MNELAGGDRALLVAHRAPRTAAACAALAAAGAAVFEIDIQLLGGTVVASHYSPVAGFRGHLQHDEWRLRWRELARADDTLAERIAAVPAGGAVLLDLKERLPHRREGLVRALVRQVADPSGFVVSSPDVDDLAQLRRAGFRTWRSVDNRAVLDRVLSEEQAEEQAEEPPADEALTVRHTALDAGRVRRAHARGVSVVAWTVNDVRRARLLRTLGVDGVTTDRVEVLRGLDAPG